MIPGPLFHVASAHRVYSTVLACTHTVLLPRFEPRALFEAIETHRIEVLSLVPTMIAMMLDHADFGSFDLTSLKAIGYGASPITEPVLRRAMAALPGVEFRQGYGATEAAPLITVLGWDEHRAIDTAPHRLRSAGVAMPHVEIRIVDAEDRDCPQGTIGEIVLRGPNVMKGYWNRPEETARALRGGWYHTGDAGYLDADGYLYIVDRVKDMIVTGGENVYSAEVENTLQQHPSVSQCAVIGVPHDTWVEAVHAVVVLNAGARASAEELIAFCRERIAGYKCPRGVSFRTEPLPLSGTNKVLKTELRALHARGEL
jgi:long-chain acyl-CoA synthetase